MPNASLTIDGTEVISKVNGSTSIQIDTVESNDIKKRASKTFNTKLLFI